MTDGSPRALLAAHGLRPKKKLGQHFLADASAARRIAERCAPRGDERIVEIGAGTGALTSALVQRGARVVAVEIDADLVTVLRARDDLPGVDVVHADALAFDFSSVFAAEPWVAAGNLPYNVATPLVTRLLELPHPPERIVAMVQRDVADRFSARPSTAAYGSLSLAVQYRAVVRRAFTLKPGAFYPRPGVDSTVVEMERRDEPAVTTRDPEFMMQVVRGAFAYRRKTVANSLSLALGIERERVQQALERLGLDTEIRGEALDLGAFAALADDLGT